MKRINSIFAACVAVIGFTVFANPLPDGKNYTEKVGDYTWTFSVENGEATIVHLGTDGYDSYWEDGQRAVEPNPQGALEIPSILGGCPVVGLGYEAINNGGMTSVVLPDSIRNVGRYALAYCYSLENIGMGNAVTNIGYGAFDYNSNLRSIVIPSTVQKIDGYVFNGCSQLLSVFFVGNAPDEVSPYLYGYGYTSDDLITFVRPGSTGWKAVGSAELPEVWPGPDQWGNGYPRPIHEWTTYPDVGWLVRFDIGEEAIRSGGGELEQMVRDGQAAVAPELAFADGYELVGWDKPFDCVSNSMTVAAIYKKDGKFLDGKNYTEKVGDYTWTFSVENGEATIVHLGKNSDGAYYEDGQRAVDPAPQGALEIPATLGGCPVVGLGYYAIYNCDSMTAVTMSDAVKNVGRYAFYDCDGLRSVELGNAVTNIGESAFVYNRFGTIALPQTLVAIGNDAFRNCSTMTQIEIPASVRSIGEGAFRYCSQLRNLAVDADNLYYSSDDGVLYDKGKETVYFWPRLKLIDIPEGVRDIRSYVFYNNYASQNGTVTLPSTVTNIGQYAFQSCYLRGVDLNEGLVSIGYGAFLGNYNLKSIVIPSTVQKIDGYVFGGCSQLLSVFFAGNAPDEVSNYLYDNTSGELMTFVRPGSTGWKTAGSVELPTMWPGPDQWGNGSPRPIREWTGYPTVGWLVQFDLGEGADRSGGGALEQMVEDGQPAIAPDLALRSGYEFAEWDRDFSKVTTPMTVRARYFKDGKRTDGEGYTETTNGCVWTYSIVDGEAVVTGVSSKLPRILEIPDVLGGCLVAAIGEYANLSSRAIIVPASIERIGDYAFNGGKWQSIWYKGNCPEAGASVYGNPYQGCSYARSDAYGWDLTVDEWLGLPIRVWDAYPNVGWDVTFDLGDYGERTGGGELNQFVVDGEGAVAPTVQAETGYEFFGWDCDFSSVTGRMTVRALYTKGGYPVGWISFNGTNYVNLDDYEGEWSYEDGFLSSRVVEAWGDATDFWAESTKRGYLSFEYRCVDEDGNPIGSGSWWDGWTFGIQAWGSGAGVAARGWKKARVKVEYDEFDIYFENNSEVDCRVMLRNFKWENPQEYVTITLDPELGKLPEGQPSELKLRTDGTYGDLPIPEREGCEFLYWTTSDWGWWGEGGEIDFDTPVAVEDTTLFAVWDVPPELILDPEGSLESIEYDWYDFGRSFDGLGYVDESNMTYVVTNRVWREYLRTECEVESGSSNTILNASFSGVGTIDFGCLEGSMDRLVCLVDGEEQELVARRSAVDIYYNVRRYSVKVLSPGGHSLELVVTGGANAYDGWSWYNFDIGGMVWSQAKSRIVVEFDPKGGEIESLTKSFRTGNVYGSFPALSARSGFEFLGWYTDPVGGERKMESDLVDFTVTKLYAHWRTDLGTALNNAQLDFSSSGATGWDGQSGASHDGVASAASGWLEWNETNTLSTTVNGKGVLSFWWKAISGVKMILDVDGAQIKLTNVKHSRMGRAPTDKNGWLHFVLSLTNDCTHTVKWLTTPDSESYNEMLSWGYDPGSIREQLENMRMLGWYGQVPDPGAWVDEVTWQPNSEQEDVVLWGHSAWQARRILPGKADPMIAWCDQRIAENPDDYDAHVRRAITCLKALAEEPVFRTLLGRYGYAFSDELMAITGAFNVDNAPLSNEAVDIVAGEVMPTLEMILADLDVIPEGWDGTVALLASQYPVDEDIYIDYADVVMAKACVHGAEAAILIAQGYDLSIDNQKLYDEVIAGTNRRKIVVSDFAGSWDDCRESKMKGFGDDGAIQLSADGKKLLARLTMPEILPEECADSESRMIELELKRKAAEGRPWDILYLSLDLSGSPLAAYGMAINGKDWSCYDLSGVGVSMKEEGRHVLLEFDLSTTDVPFEGLSGFALEGAKLVWGSWTEEEYFGSTYEAMEEVFVIESKGFEYDPELTIEAVLAAHPQCVSAIRDQASLNDAKLETRLALNLCEKFDIAVKSRTSGKMHFFEYDPKYAERWQAVAKSVQLAKAALDDVGTLKGKDYVCVKKFKQTNLNERVTLKPFFDGRILRDLLPPFVGDRPVLSSIPDIKFAGTFPDWTMENRMEWLKKIDGVWYDAPIPPPEEPEIAYTITYLGLEGSANPNPATFTAKDLPLTLGPVERDGFRFLGWMPRNGVIPLGTASNVTFTAIWEVVNPNAPGMIVDPAPTEAEAAPLAVEDMTVAQTYNGYLTNVAAEVVGSVTVKVAKKGKVTATVQLPDGSGSKALKKFSYMGTLDAPGRADLTCRKNKGTMSLFVGKAVITGMVMQGGETYGITCRLGSKDVLKTVDLPSGKVWTVALHTPTNGVPHPLMRGYSCLTVTSAKQGKVKVSGFLADGTKVSVTAQGMVFGSKCIVVPVGVALYKGKAGGFSMKLMIDGDRLTIGNVSDWTALINGHPYSVKWDAAFVSVKTDLANGAVFVLDEARIPIDVIAASRDGTSILPNDVAIEVVNGKWKLPKAGKVVLTKDKSDLDVEKFKANGESDPNPSGLKLGYTAKSGTFKGSFALYQDASKGTPKLKKVSVTVNGVVVDDGEDGVGYGSAVIKKTGSIPVTIRK